MPVAVQVRAFDRTVALTFVAFIVLGLPEGLLGLAWPSIRDGFGLTQDAIGGFLLAGTLGFMLTSFNSGTLIERLGAGGLLIAASLLRGGAFMALLIAPSWAAMIACGFVAGMGTGMLDAGGNTYLSRYGSTRLMNWLHASFGVGATLGPFIMGSLFDAGLSWRWGYVIVGGLQLIVGTVVLTTLSHWQNAPLDDIATEDGTQARNISPLATLRLWPVWFGIALFAFYAGLEVSAGQWTYTLFTEGRSVNMDVAELFVSLYWGSFTIGRILFGGIGDNLKPANLVRGSALGMIAGALLIWLNPAGIGQFVGLGVLGFALAPAFPTLIAATPGRVGRRHAPNTIGFQVGAASIGIALFPWLGGLLAETGSVESAGVGASTLGMYLFPDLSGLSTGSTGLEAIGPLLVALAVMIFITHEGLLVISQTGAKSG